MGRVKVVKINGREYVALPIAEYRRMVGVGDLKGAVDAVEYGRRSLGRSLRAAREAAGLTQAALANKLGKAQPMVSGAETGAVRVGERYVADVLKACGLPRDWKAPKLNATKLRAKANAWPRSSGTRVRRERPALHSMRPVAKKPTRRKEVA
jgi:transcriptional regulator with XRE-family HTH domain